MKFPMKLLLVGGVGTAFLALAGTLTLPSVARHGVEKGAGSALGVEASLEDVIAGLGPRTTDFGLKGLAFASPEGFEGAPLLDVGEASVEVGTWSLLSDTVRVPEIKLDGLRLNWIQQGTESNLGPVLRRIKDSLQGGESGEPDAGDEEEAAASNPKALAFGKVSVSAVGVSLELTGVPGIDDQSYAWTAPAFVLDLSDEANRRRVDSVEDLSRELVQELVTRSMGAAGAEVPAPVMAVLTGELSIGSAKDDLIDKAKEKLGETIDKELGGAIDDLFGKDR